MTTPLRRVVASVAGLALTAGLTVGIIASPAGAASDCAPEDRAYGASQVHAQKASKWQQRTAKNLKKAKKAYRKHHTKANKRKLKRAKRSHSRAVANNRAWQQRYAASRDTAARCHARSDGPGAPQGAAPDPTAVFEELLAALQGLGGGGFTPEQLQAIAQQIADALAGGASPETVTGIIQQLADALTGAGGDTPIDPAMLQGYVDQFADAVGGAGLPADQFAQLFEDFAGALASGNVDPELLVRLVDTITGALVDGGAPLDGTANALHTVLTDITAGNVPTDLKGLIDVVIDSVQTGLGGTPLEDPLSPDVLEPLQVTLDEALGGLPGLDALFSGALPIPLG